MVAAKASVRQAWKGFWTLRKERPEPAWARIIIACALAVAGSLALVLLAGLLQLKWFDPAWWRSLALPLMAIALVTGLTLLGAIRTLELMLPASALERLQACHDWRPALLLNTVAGAAMVLGSAIGMGLLQAFYDHAAWTALALPGQRLHAALLIMILVGTHAAAWGLRVRHAARRRRGTEAQLRLLQAQIEPHFLFTTLAGVQSLLDRDPELARAMLEEFTDYLRASLGQLRKPDATLGAELDMAQCYLQLMRFQMGDGLRFSIEASVLARAAVVPPLLLQPLIDNAVRHGIGARSAGLVVLHAAVDRGRVTIEVRDDGVGFGGAAGEGGALDNIRARLQARYGSEATLAMEPRLPGTCARLDLPFVGAAVDSSHMV